MKIKNILKVSKNFILHTVPTFTVKHLPAILTFTGVASVGTGFVVGCIQSTKLKDVNAKVQSGIEQDKIKLQEKTEVTGVRLIPIYLKNGGRYVKLYWLPVTLELAGLAAIVGSHLVHQKRGKELAAAYTALLLTSENYRQAVRNRYGDDIDTELANGVIVEETETKKGNKKTTQQDKVLTEPNSDEFKIIFKPGCPGWTNAPEIRMSYLRSVERHADSILQIKKSLFLNDILDMLGYPRTKIGQTYGWSVLGVEKEELKSHVVFDIISASDKNWKTKDENGDNIDKDVYIINFNVQCKALEYLK